LEASCRALVGQHRLKPAARPARAEIVAAELLDQLDIAVHDALASFDTGFRRERPAALGGDLKRLAMPSKLRGFLAMAHLLAGS